MSIQKQIEAYISTQPEAKSNEMLTLHNVFLESMPGCKLWFLDGKNEDNKTVSNPNIGYDSCTINYADGKTRAFYRVGMSANKAGISVYIFGLEEKTYLAKTYGEKIGKAKITGYCIKFKTLKDINIEVLKTAISNK